MLSLPAASWALPADTFTVNVPSADGVISAVYVVPEPAKLLSVPLPTETSPDTNPVTGSLKVIVIAMGELLVGLVSVLVILTVGFVASLLFVSVAAVPVLPAESVNVTLKVIVPSFNPLKSIPVI